MKSFNIKISMYLSILVFSYARGSEMTLVKDSAILDSLETAIINQITELKAKGVNATDSQGRTPLFLAAQHNQSEIIKQLLQDKDIDVNKPDNHGFTPLDIAVNNCHEEAVNTLLDYQSKIKSKLDLELRDKRLGYTPLMRAAKSGNESIVRLLLNAGSSPLATVAKDQKNLGIEELVSKDHQEVTQLILDKKKEYNDRTELLAKLLFEKEPDLQKIREIFFKGINFDHRKWCDLALYKAVSKKELNDISRLLIANKANVDVSVNDGGFHPEYICKPLHKATIAHNKEMVELLIKNKADVNCVESGPYVQTLTPLHYAIMNQNIEIIKLLIDANANVNAKLNNDHATPLNFAFTKRRADIAQLLINVGAKCFNNEHEFGEHKPNQEIIKLIHQNNIIATYVEQIPGSMRLDKFWHTKLWSYRTIHI